MAVTHYSHNHRDLLGNDTDCNCLDLDNHPQDNFVVPAQRKHL